ncbi:MAG: hypothetical protein FVQ77_11550 [Cytophagales bacterium]|nr:hypothetical protein [Cytophagales bacterium]
MKNIINSGLFLMLFVCLSAICFAQNNKKNDKSIQSSEVKKQSQVIINQSGINKTNTGEYEKILINKQTQKISQKGKFEITGQQMQLYIAPEPKSDDLYEVTVSQEKKQVVKKDKPIRPIKMIKY